MLAVLEKSALIHLRSGRSRCLHSVAAAISNELVSTRVGGGAGTRARLGTHSSSEHPGEMRTIPSKHCIKVRALSCTVGASSTLSFCKPFRDNNDARSCLRKRISMHIRTFQNVAHYHNIADDTLHLIQDEVEALIEDNLNEDEGDNIPEVNYADGVLTMYFPPHGTWVINKQTPNQQLWWSSPVSGPRRYEYEEERERWVNTRVGGGSNDAEETGEDTLGSILTREVRDLYGWDLTLEA